MKRQILLSLVLLISIFSMNAQNEFYFNGGADVILRAPARGSGGRAIVHDGGNILTLNYAGDFTGGTRIGSNVYFSNNGNSFVNTGNFGIGTASPNSKLEVHGTTSIGQYTNGTAVIDAFDSYAYFGCNSATNGIAVGPNGYVGVGTTAPDYNLTINGNFKVTNAGNEFSFNGGADVILRAPARGSGGRAIVHDGGNILTLNYEGDFTGGTRIGSNVYFSNIGNSFVNTGNFGIGTASPNSKLEVHGTTTIGQYTNGTAVIDAFDSYAYFGCNSATNGIAVGSNGYIGIGTINPTYQLDVKGTIHAREVKVDLDFPADYVFKSGYKLLTLEEVEQFIKSNSHLPEIPSASEIKENGLNIGDMQNKLLQKIEEMTLYMIEQNKKIEELEKQNAKIKALEEKIAKFETALK